MPGQCRKRVLNVSASSRSRKLGTAFRSPVTTLAPPLRGQCSCPVPSLPRRKSPRIRSIGTLSLSSVSKPKPGECQRADPLSAGFPAAPETSSGPHSPSGIATLRIEAFNRLHHRKPALPDAWLSLAPRRDLFRFRFGARNPVCVLRCYRSVNPGTESIMNRNFAWVK